MPNASPRASDPPPALCLVGRKNSGKTTLMVAVVAELTRRGYRVATIKHGHHDFESDQPGRDSWRHFNQGGAEASIMCGTGKVALTMRIPGEPDPETLIRELCSGRGYDLVLIEGWKQGALPKIEVFREAAGHEPLSDGSGSEGFVAVATDVPGRWAHASIPVVPLDAALVAQLIERRLVPDAP